jgi:hypothetical protein
VYEKIMKSEVGERQTWGGNWSGFVSGGGRRGRREALSPDTMRFECLPMSVLSLLLLSTRRSLRGADIKDEDRGVARR